MLLKPLPEDRGYSVSFLILINSHDLQVVELKTPSELGFSPNYSVQSLPFNTKILPS